MTPHFVNVTLFCCLCSVLVTGCAQQEPLTTNTAADDPEHVQFVESALQPEREFELRFERWLGQRKNK